MRANGPWSAVAAVVVSGLLAGCLGADPGVRTTFVRPMSDASGRQAADTRPTQQLMMDLKSIGLDPGAVVRYGGGPSTSPTFAVEYGGPVSLWRIEEFPPPAGIDLAELQYQIEGLHRASARLIEAELKLRLAETALQAPSANACGLPACDGRCGRGHGRRAAGPPREVHHAAAELAQRRHDVERREHAVRDMLRDPNLLVFRWQAPDGSQAGYAVAAGLRRIRLVLGNDFARLTAYGAVDEAGAMHDSEATGVVTAALQARQVIYVEQPDMRDTVTRVLGAMGADVRSLLTTRDILEMELAIAFENERLDSFQHRGFYSRPRRYTIPVVWPDFLAGRMPAAIGGGVHQPGSSESEWVTFVAATTQLRTLEAQGRLGPRGG